MPVRAASELCADRPLDGAHAKRLEQGQARRARPSGWLAAAEPRLPSRLPTAHSESARLVRLLGVGSDGLGSQAAEVRPAHLLVGCGRCALGLLALTLRARGRRAPQRARAPAMRTALRERATHAAGGHAQPRVR